VNLVTPGLTSTPPVLENLPAEMRAAEVASRSIRREERPEDPVGAAFSSPRPTRTSSPAKRSTSAAASPCTDRIRRDGGFARRLIMKVLVIGGGTGTVGSQVVRQLVERRASVRALVRNEASAAKLPKRVEPAIGDGVEAVADGRLDALRQLGRRCLIADQGADARGRSTSCRTTCEPTVPVPPPITKTFMISLLAKPPSRRIRSVHGLAAADVDRLAGDEVRVGRGEEKAAPTGSSGRSSRRIDRDATSAARISAGRFSRTGGVEVRPGVTRFTVTPSPPNSRARHRVRPTRPALALVYGVWRRRRCRPTPSEVDDAAPAAAGHQRVDRLDHQERAGQGDVHQPPPRLGG
jgi:hypothetical protein